MGYQLSHAQKIHIFNGVQMQCLLNVNHILSNNLTRVFLGII